MDLFTDVTKTLVIGIDPGTFFQGLSWGELDHSARYGMEIGLTTRVTLHIPAFDPNGYDKFIEQLSQSDILNDLIKRAKEYDEVVIGIEEPILRVSQKRHSNRALRKDKTAAQILLVTSWWNKYMKRQLANVTEAQRVRPYRWVGANFGSRRKFAQTYQVKGSEHEIAALLVGLNRANARRQLSKART